MGVDEHVERETSVPMARDVEALTTAFAAVAKASAATSGATTTTHAQRRECLMRERIAMYALRARLLERNQQTLVALLSMS